MNETVLHDEVREWLDTKGVSLWADWLITSDDGMDDAVEWFVQELRSFWKYRLNRTRNVQPVMEFDVV